MSFEFTPGTAPLLISVPHAGTEVPDEIAHHLGSAARDLTDTDWHVHRLAKIALEHRANLLSARFSRYVIDLNRGPDDKPLYAGPTTGLIPTETFDGEPLYENGLPDRADCSKRVEQFWKPYHARLAAVLDDVRNRHGFAILLDLHSIRSRVPRLFDGRLPDLNLGTYDGASCHPELETEAASVLADTTEFTHIVNGRFKGGYITRHYGRPAEHIHALQLEIAQACYMDEDQPALWDEDRARPLKQLLDRLVQRLTEWRRQ